MPLDFMSQSNFDSGGPYGSATGTAAGGFGQLAQAIAQGPKIRAQANYMGAEADKARAETAGLTQQQGLVSQRAGNIAELRDLIADPQLFSDPAKRSRAVALVNADPDLAKNSREILGTAIGMATLNHAISAADRDAFVGATGGAAWGNTETGGQAGLANARTIENMSQTGQTTRTGMTIAGNQALQDSQTVNAVPAGSPPGTTATAMTRKQANDGGFRIVSEPEATSLATGTVSARPAGTGPDVPPTISPLATVLSTPGGYTAVSPSQQAAEAAPTSVVLGGRPALMGTGAATASGAQPILGGGTNEVQGVGAQITAFPNGPVDLGSTVANGGQPTSAPAPAPTPTAPTVSVSGNPQPPAPTATPPTPTPPTPTPTPTLGNAFGNAAFGSTPPSATPATPPGPTPAQRVGAATVDATGGVMPKGNEAAETEQRVQQVKMMGPQMYPAGTGPSGGMAGELGPAAQAKILARASELADSRGSRYVNNWTGAITQAKQELQASGQLPPDASQTADWKRTAHITGKNVIELAPPGTYTPVTQGAPGTGTQGQGTQTTTGFKQAPDGTFWRQTPSGWVKADAQGNPLGAAPGVTTANPPAAPTTSGPTIRWPFAKATPKPDASPAAPLVPGHDPHGVLASPFVRRLQETFGGGQ